MKLSDNFNLEDITKTPEASLSAIKMFLIKNLVINILQPWRNELKVPILITSGERTAQDFDRLQAQGYNPSITSDHNFGNPCFLPKDSPKLKIFGPIYNFSVGAADTQPAINMKQAFNILKKMHEAGKVKIGQVIYEYTPGANPKEWIHIANPASLFFSQSFINLANLQANTFMQSLDGGKSYQIVSGELK